MVKALELNSIIDDVKHIKDFMKLEIKSAKDKYSQNLPSQSFGTFASTHFPKQKRKNIGQ